MAGTVIRFVRGDTHIINLEVSDSNGAAYSPGVDDTITMTVRSNDDTGTAVITKETGVAEEGEIPDVVASATGWSITLQPEDTADLPYGKYVYDIELDMDGIIQTVIPMSSFILDKEVTYTEAGE
jgi:hypothetical protein